MQKALSKTIGIGKIAAGVMLKFETRVKAFSTIKT